LKLIVGKYEGTIYPEGNGYTGAIDVGYDGKGNRQRIKRKGRTKEIVKDKLKKAVSELGQFPVLRRRVVAAPELDLGAGLG
jgi:hypothetical protein